MLTKILIVDDEKPVRDFASRLLERNGYSCTQAADAFDARRWMQHEQYPLALVDIKMPGESGMDLVRYISSTHRDMATLIVTGVDEPQVAQAALQTGAFGYLVKPFEPNELLINVANALHRRELEMENRAHRDRLEQAVQHRTAALQVTIKRREQAECELRAAHMETEQILASISSLLIGVDENGLVSRWNEAAVQTFGIPAREVLGQPFAQCGIQWQHADVMAFVAQCQGADRPTRIDELKFIGREGHEGFLGVTINPIKGNDQRRGGFLLLGRDLTERKNLEDQLRQAQKLEAIGQLAAGIAHELNTPIQYVGDNANFLSDAFKNLQEVLRAHNKLLIEAKSGAPTAELVAEVERILKNADIDYLNEEIPKAIQQSLEGVRRVAKIVRAMKEFAHPGSEEKTPIDINKAIENTIIVARTEWKYVAEIVTDFDPQLPLVPCLAGEFNQVILNLIVNAAHAIADIVSKDDGQKGTITVTTSRATDQVEIRIRDSGTGIPESVRSKIFNPFFTTKPLGKGTGQGLAISHVVIVKKHNGTISFETELGKGTTFIIRLPFTPDAIVRQQGRLSPPCQELR